MSVRGWHAAAVVLIAAAAAAEPKPVTTAITAVTVYADRAQVTRTGTVDLPGGSSRVAIQHLPGWIDAESVRATIVPSSAGQILDVAVETTFLAQANEEAVRVAQAAVQELSDEAQALADEEKVLQDEIARLESLRAFSIDKLPKELATRDVSVKTLSDTLAFVSETLRRDRKLLRELAVKRRALAPELAARTAKYQELETRSQMQESAVVLDISGSGRATIVLTYLTPGAAWEPVGELRVTKGGSAVALAQYASVVQSTGEDWDGAKLAFSTQRPGEVLDIPEAQALLLGAGGAGLRDVLGKMGSSFDRAQLNYAAQNEAYGKTRAYWSENIANQQEVQTRAAETFAKLADRGTTAHFNALSQRTVRADGKAVRVPIASEEFAAKVRLVCVPEATLNVVRTAEIEHGQAPDPPRQGGAVRGRRVRGHLRARVRGARRDLLVVPRRERPPEGGARPRPQAQFARAGSQQDPPVRVVRDHGGEPQRQGARARARRPRRGGPERRHRGERRRSARRREAGRERRRALDGHREVERRRVVAHRIHARVRQQPPRADARGAPAAEVDGARGRAGTFPVR